MYKKFFVFASIFIIVIAGHGQTCKKPFLGSKTLYKGEMKTTQAPAGYLPVFINHVGRHGARHVTSDINTTEIYRLLLRADSLNGLTVDGKLLKEKVLKLEKIEKKNFKSISYEGKTEQQGIADRMYATNAVLFSTPKPVIDVDYTKEIRTLQTSDAFLTELRTKVSDPVITRQINDTTLRFYDLSPAYLDFKKKGSWIQYLQRVKSSLHYKELVKQISQKFFTADYFKTFSETDQDEFVSGLFGFITIFYSIQQEAEETGYKKEEVDMQSFISCQQLAILGKINDAEDFYVKGPGTNVNGIQVKIAVPLLVDFIKTTDNYIKTGSSVAKLRFTHAEAIAPYAALMGISYASKATNNINEVSKIWDASKIIELSANIQWILYKKKNTADYLVKFLLNEKEVAIAGLTTKTFPYYKWEDVRNFYLKKIKGFNTNPDDNSLDYLKTVR